MNGCDQYPAWVLDIVAPGDVLPGPEETMQRAIDVSRANIRNTSGGPFGALIVASDGKVISIGYNQVVPNSDSTAHAEVLAIRHAQAIYRTSSLREPGLPDLQLFTSCAPCLMCIGAIHWAGIPEVIAAARSEDAEAIGFVEGAAEIDGPAFLASRQIQYRGDLLRAQAVAVLRQYHGDVYNG